MYDPKHIVEGSEYQLFKRIANRLQQRITVLYCICFPFTVIDFCLLEVFRPIWEFYSRLETSAWTVKGGKFLPMLALMALSNDSSTPTVTRGIRL